MEVGARIIIDDGVKATTYTILEIDNYEEMCRLLNEETGVEEIEPFWAMEYMWDVTVL